MPALAAWALSASCAAFAREANAATLDLRAFDAFGPIAPGDIEADGVPFYDNNTTVGGSDTINRLPASCIPREYLNGPERIYRIVVDAGEDVPLTFIVTPETPNYDPAIYLTDERGSGEHCLAGTNDHGPGERETFSVSVCSAAGKAYYLYVDGVHGVVGDISNAAGPYQLEIFSTTTGVVRKTPRGAGPRCESVRERQRTTGIRG